MPPVRSEIKFNKMAMRTANPVAATATTRPPRATARKICSPSKTNSSKAKISVVNCSTSEMVPAVSAAFHRRTPATMATTHMQKLKSKATLSTDHGSICRTRRRTLRARRRRSWMRSTSMDELPSGTIAGAAELPPCSASGPGLKKLSAWSARESSSGVAEKTVSSESSMAVTETESIAFSAYTPNA